LTNFGHVPWDGGSICIEVRLVQILGVLKTQRDTIFLNTVEYGKDSKLVPFLFLLKKIKTPKL
jgi:hypothetical protein